MRGAGLLMPSQEAVRRKVAKLREEAEAAKTKEQWAFDNQYEIYLERDLLVAALARLWPSHVMEHTHSPRSKGRRLVICIHAPFGHITWTIPEELEPSYRATAQCGENDYDGCKTTEKRERLLRFVVTTPCVFPPDATPLRKAT
jgi:hypothetical protein